FYDTLKRERSRVKDALAQGKTIAVALPGECPTQGNLNFYVSFETPKNWGRSRVIERSADNGVVTNDFNDSGDPLGVGVAAGFYFAPRGNLRVGPFVSLDYLNQTINHTFFGGTFLGTTTHWIGTVGVKGGVMTSPGLFAYGLAGVSFLNEDLNINFGGPVKS